MHYTFDIENDHFQILLGDRDRGPLVDTTQLWGSAGSVAVTPNAPELVGLGTARYGGKTRVHVETSSSPPRPQSGWTEMGKFALYVPSGEIIIWAPESLDLRKMPTVSIERGRYLGFAFSQGTDAVVDEMATDGPDEYRIVLWRSE